MTALEIARLRRRIRINWEEESVAWLASRMADQGFSARYIGQETGLKPSAVYYRLRELGIHITDYRNGIGPVAQQIRRQTAEITDRDIAKRIRKMLKAKLAKNGSP